MPSSRAGPAALDVLGKVETRRQELDLAERLREQQTKIWERIVAAEPRRRAEANAPSSALAVFNQARLLGYGRGRYDDSFALYQRASSIAAKAVELAPEDVRWRIAQAYVESSLAISLSDRSQVDASVAGMDRVRDEVKDLSPDPSVDLRFRNLLAVVHCDLGGLAMRLERLTDAAVSKGKCADMRADILASRPGAADDLLRLAEARRGVAYALRLQGHVARASSELERAVSATRELFERDHGNLDAERELGLDLSFLGDSLALDDDAAGADPAIQEGLSILRQVATARAENMNAQRDLIRSLQIAGEIATVRRDLGAAMRAFDDATVVIDHLKAKQPDASKWLAFLNGFVELWISRAHAEILAGRAADARADLDAADAGTPASSDNADDVLTHARIDLLRGDQARAQGRRDDAEADYGRAAERAEACVPRLPQMPDTQRTLAEARVNLGELRAQRGDRAQARTLGMQAASALAELDAAGELEAPQRQLIPRARALAGP